MRSVSKRKQPRSWPGESEIALPLLDPQAVSVEDLQIVDPPATGFDGFRAEAFEILARLRAEPHIGCYRQEKEGIDRYIVRPFRVLRDDLAANWLLPSRLALETERSVFGRLLKNDFGAGGCHHHYWMAFYRPALRRLTDYQWVFSLSPDGFEVGLYAGETAADRVAAAREQIGQAPQLFLARLNPLLDLGYSFAYTMGAVRSERICAAPMPVLPPEVLRAKSLWVGRQWPRDEMLHAGGALVGQALASVRQLWPLYLFYLAGTDRR